MRHLRQYRGRTVTVVITHGGDQVATLTGHLAAANKDGLELHQPSLIPEQAVSQVPTGHPIDGRLFLPAHQVISVQIREG